MKLVVTPEVLDLFPEALLGAILLRGCDNRGGGSSDGVAGETGAAGEGVPERDGGTGSAIEAALRRAEQAARDALASAVLAEEPRIACWREAYRRFGANPKKHASSIESLLRRVLRGEALRPVSPLVDTYNAVSLERLLPVGGEDLDQVRGDVALARAGPAEPPALMLGETEAHAPHPGEVIYRDDVAALCRRWNWKEAERTKLTAATRQALLVIEALPPHGRADLEKALADLASRITHHCGGQAATAILGAGSREMALG